jgi:uncharacterized membrane protein (DUF373 family)
MARRAAAELLDWMHRLRGTFGGLTFYERFEHAVVLILTALIVVVVGVATWHLTLAVLALVFANEIHPANQAVFQAIFGMVFTVIIALEFKHSLLIALARQESVVRLRSVILIAMLAMVRKFIVLDLGTSAPGELLALAAATVTGGDSFIMSRHEQQIVVRMFHASDAAAAQAVSARAVLGPDWAARIANGPPSTC